MLLPLLLHYFHCLVIVLFGCFLNVYLILNNLTSWVKNDEIDKSYDYIIVGGGSAGAVLALRLSENKNVSVLVIEAGTHVPDILQIPVLGPLKHTTGLDWQYKTVPQKNACLGLTDNSSKWPSGKALGGSTHLNYMVYLKGNDKDFATWKHPHSDEWSFSDINSYFKKSVEHVTADDSDENEDSYGNERGSVVVRDASFTTDFSSAILKAASEIGYDVLDLNAEGNAIGFMRPQVNIHRDGKRWTSDQKLRKASSLRKNLKLLTNARAERILLCGNGFEACGIEYRRGGGRLRRVAATEEILLSAGAIGSAKILLMSGVGPEDALKKSGIEAKVDLPVGKYLQDHVTTGLDLIVLNETAFSMDRLTDPRSAYDYFIRGIGPFTSAMVEAIGLVHSDPALSSTDGPDLEFMAMMAGVTSDGGLFSRHALGISDKLWNDYFALIVRDGAASAAAVSVLPVLLHPRSVGEVSLDPSDPIHALRIDPRYLSDEADVDTLVRGIRIVQRLVATEAMTRFGARFNDLILPGCEFHDFDTDDYWRCYVRHLTLTSYHPVGTCRMGAEDSVVDHRLRVRKTNKLRVIDASVMPTMPSANTNAAVMMIAEKAADLIKEDYYARRSTSSIREILMRSRRCELPS